MALTATTNLGYTGYTGYHSHSSTTTYDVDSLLRVRSGPGTGYSHIGSHYPGDWWTICDEYYGWYREPSSDRWTSGDYQSNRNITYPTPGEFRTNLKVTVTRETSYTKSITVKYEWNVNSSRGNTETYYNWRVYAYAAKIGGGEAQADIYNRSQNVASNGNWNKSVTYTVDETSGNTTVSPGNYGIWYHGNGTYKTQEGGLGAGFTINVPKYIAASKPTTTAIAVSNISTTGAKISGTHNNNGATIDKYTFGYRVVNGSWNDSEVTSNSRTLSGLTPNTRYEYRARAHNAVGWGDYKSGSYFWTKPSAATPTVSNTAKTATTATCKVTKASSGNYPNINLYELSYKKSSASSWTTLSTNSTGTFSLSSLSPNTQYNIRGRVRTGTGGNGTTAWSGYSSTVSFYTSPQAGTATASCVRNNTQNSLNIKVNTAGTYTPAVNRYQIRYKLSTASSWTTMTDSANQTQTISSLTAGSTYNIQVRARTNTGLDGTTAWSAWSSSLSVRVVKTNTLDVVDFVSNTTNSITIKVSYTNNYPNANRIYYALVPPGTDDPGRVANMFVSTSSSPTSITITKDYQGNALTVNTSYKLYVKVNQYKAASDWYTAGLDLVSNTLEMYVATTVNVGTLSNVSCIRNNTYNSLTFKADKAGNWTVYKGWQYRYKKSSDTNYSTWSQDVNTSNKTISNLTAGETYDIQIRGTTGQVADVGEYYSPIYSLQVKVAKRPTLQLSINSITTNKVKITAKIIDRGYPELNSIVWYYSSNSYITLTYVPNTYVQASTTNITSTITSTSYEYTLYKQARYNFKVEARQYKAGSDWYTAGIDNRTAFIIEDKELSLYDGRTDRLKVSQNGTLKTVDKIYHTEDGSTWKYDGQRKDAVSVNSSMQWAYTKTCTDINYRPNWFYGNGSSHGNNTLVRDNFEVFIPMVDNVRSDISTAYGGNLLPNKLDIDFTQLSTSTDLKLSSTSSYFDVRFTKNSLSAKLTKDYTNINSYLTLFRMYDFSKILNMNIIDSIYIEYNVNVIPNNSDNSNIGSIYAKYIIMEDTSKRLGEIPSKPTNKSRVLMAIPVRKLLELNYKFNEITFYVVDDSSWPNVGFKIQKAGSIINFSNFGFYYTLL